MAYTSQYYDPEIKPSQSLSVYQSGWQKCGPSHSFGPTIRDHYVIHYIISGKGTYHCGEKELEVHAKQGFLIPPNVSTFYKADEEQPWEYYWVGFHGTDAKKMLSLINLSSDKLIFTYDKDDAVMDILKNLYFSSIQYESREYAMIGYLYLFFSCMMPATQYAKKPSQDYIEKAVNYMNTNFSYPINVDDIARHVGIERSYLYRLFEAALQCSPYSYLLNLRLEKAYEMISHSNLTITQISLSHGFQDLSHFSKLFKKKYNISPKEYRKSIFNAAKLP